MVAPPPPSEDPFPSRLPDFFHLLDYSGDWHLSRSDITKSLINVALFPSLPDLDELVTFAGDGSFKTFKSKLDDPTVSTPRLLTPGLFNDLKSMDEGKLLVRDSHSFAENFFWVFIAYFAFPLNIFYGKQWALKAMEKYYFEDHWKTFLHVSIALDFIGLVMIVLSAIGDSSAAPTTTIMYYVIKTVALSTQVIYEAKSNEPEFNLSTHALKVAFQHCYYLPITEDGARTNVRDFSLHLFRDCNHFKYFTTSLTTRGVASLTAGVGRRFLRPSIIHADDVENATTQSNTHDRDIARKFIYTRAQKKTYVISALTAAVPLVQSLVAASHGDATDGKEIAVGALFFVALVPGMLNAIPPLQEHAPLALKDVAKTSRAYLDALKMKQRGESAEGFKLTLDNEHLRAAREIKNVMKLFVMRIDKDNGALSSLGFICTVLVSLVVAFKVIIDPTFSSIITDQVTLVCLAQAIYNTSHLVPAINHAITANDNMGKGQASVMHGIMEDNLATLAFSDCDEETRERLEKTNVMLAAMADDALRFQAKVKVLGVPVTVELRLKIFGLLLSLAMSTVLRLVQQYFF
jgi:hypothetical protein